MIRIIIFLFAFIINDVYSQESIVWKDYIDSQNSYLVSYPKNWEALISPSDTALSYAEPHGFSFFFFASGQKPKDNDEDF